MPKDMNQRAAAIVAMATTEDEPMKGKRVALKWAIEAHPMDLSESLEVGVLPR